jgi:hypothetical protein
MVTSQKRHLTISVLDKSWKMLVKTKKEEVPICA